MSFNTGHYSLITFRTLFGKVSQRPLKGIPSSIGGDKYDSYTDGNGTHVIRRACQTLPCFLIHFQQCLIQEDVQELMKRRL
jgi:hypothetical protein